MAEKDPETAPSLELPSLFGRRKRRGDSAVASAETPPAEQTEHTAVLPAVEPTTAPPTAPAPPVAPHPTPAPASSSPAATGATAASTDPAIDTDMPPATSGRRRAVGSRNLPEMAATTAAFVVGALVGLLGCVLTYIGLQGCELITGTGSCGGPGLLVLIVILVLMVIAGTIALRALRVPDPGNVSFLGVGMMTVVALLVLIDYLYEPSMFLVVPAITALTYAFARWITTMYADDMDDDDRGMPHVDIR
jgi:hypothetical protein